MQSSTPIRDAVLRIGTRGSPLALAQARMVRARLAAAHGVAPERIAIEIIRTTGDVIHDRPLAEVGGKGLFTKEIEEALLASADRPRGAFGQGHADRAAARACDRGVLPREDAARRLHQPQRPSTLRDCRKAPSSAPHRCGGRRWSSGCGPISTSCPFRGNVETRLRKLDEGEVDATLLALAGLKRLGLADAATAILSIEEFLPAVGQGDHRDRGARRRRAHARAARRHRSRRHRDRARGRARLPRGARRLLPHADRRPCRHRARRGCAFAA